eukprot:1988830-Pyramimonas_sp.AAC.2
MSNLCSNVKFLSQKRGCGRKQTEGVTQISRGKQLTCRNTTASVEGEAVGASERAGGGSECEFPCCSLFEEQEPASSPQLLHAEGAICLEKDETRSSMSPEGGPSAPTIWSLRTCKRLLEMSTRLPIVEADKPRGWTRHLQGGCVYVSLALYALRHLIPVCITSY